MLTEYKDKTEIVSGGTFQGLTRALEGSFPDVYVANPKEGTLPSEVNLLVAFCPAYAHGDLSNSKLISPPQSLEDSRVFGKVEAYKGAIEAVSKYAKLSGSSVNVVFVHANKGVILKGQPSPEDDYLLAYSDSLYRNYTQRLSDELGVNYKFFNYDDLNVNFPRFVDLDSPIPTPNPGLSEADESSIIKSMNDYLHLPVSIEDNKRSRKVVKGVVKNNGVNGAFWLISGYLPFDWMIPKIIGSDGLYLVSERADSLFGVSKLTKSLDQMTRYQFKV